MYNLNLGLRLFVLSVLGVKLLEVIPKRVQAPRLLPGLKFHKNK